VGHVLGIGDILRKHLDDGLRARGVKSQDQSRFDLYRYVLELIEFTEREIKERQAGPNRRQEYRQKGVKH